MPRRKQQGMPTVAGRFGKKNPHPEMGGDFVVHRNDGRSGTTPYVNDFIFIKMLPPLIFYFDFFALEANSDKRLNNFFLNLSGVRPVKI